MLPNVPPQSFNTNSRQIMQHLPVHTVKSPQSQRSLGSPPTRACLNNTCLEE